MTRSPAPYTRHVNLPGPLERAAIRVTRTSRSLWEWATGTEEDAAHSLLSAVMAILLGCGLAAWALACIRLGYWIGGRH